MNRAALPIQQMAEAAGKVIFGEMFSAPKDEDPKWVKLTWDRVVTAIEASLTRLPDGDVDKFTRARIRESAFCEAADWHQGEAERKRDCAVKNRTLRAQIATHMVSEAAIRSLMSQNKVSMLAPPPRAQALDVSSLERIAKLADDYDHPDENGPFPDIQDAMVTVGDLRKVRETLAALRALSSQPVADGWLPTHRHKKRGTEYRVIGKAQVQCTDGLTDYELVTVYIGQDDQMWVRRTPEFEDGRFEALPATPEVSG